MPPWPSGMRIMATSTRWPRSPVTRPDQSPSIMPRPSSSRPSAAKNAIAASSDSTTMPTLSIRCSATSRLSRIPGVAPGGWGGQHALPAPSLCSLERLAWRVFDAGERPVGDEPVTHGAPEWRVEVRPALAHPGEHTGFVLLVAGWIDVDAPDHVVACWIEHRVGEPD